MPDMEQTVSNTTSVADCIGVLAGTTNIITYLCLSVTALIALSCFKASNYATPFSGHRCGLLTPIPFLESPLHRLMIVAVFAMASINLTSLIMQSIFSNYSTLVKVIQSASEVAVLCILYLPILSCISVQATLTSVIGIIYTSTLTTLVLLTNTPICNNMGPGIILACFITYIIVLPSGIYLVTKFVFRLWEDYKQSTAIASQPPTPEEIYVRSLFHPQNQFGEYSKLKKYCTQFCAYSSERGFQFSTTILVSITVGITTVTLLMVVYIGELTEVFMIMVKVSSKSKFSQLIEYLWGFQAKNGMVNAVEAFYGGVLTALIVTYIFTVISIFQIMRSYQHNTLKIARNQTTKLLSTDQMKPFQIVFSAVQYGGFQVAHFIWAFHVQAFVLSIVFTGVAFFTLLLFTYNQWNILLRIVEFALPLIVVVGGTILLQWILVKRYFLQNEGNELAIANRKGFYAMMYFMFFYNALRGMFTCAARIIAAIIFAGWFFARLDQSIFPARFEKYDRGFLAFACLLRLEEMQNNRIMTTFLKIVKRSTDDQRKLSINLPGQRPNNKGRKRWFLAWTLLHNPALREDRRYRYATQPLLLPHSQPGQLSINTQRENSYVC